MTQQITTMILDGDFVGHGFRGNQHVSASGESRSAVRSSQRAKHAEKHGDPKAQKKAHKTAYFSHMAAAEEAKGVTRSYHRKMAKFHGGRSGVVLDSVEESLILDDADAYESIVGTIKKGSKIVGRAHVGGDGKSMIFLGKTGKTRVKYVSPVDGVMREFMWSDDDVGDMVDALFMVPENGVAKAAPVVEPAPVVPAEPARSTQFLSYMAAINEGKGTPGMLEQIRTDARLEDGEAEILIAQAKSVTPAGPGGATAEMAKKVEPPLVPAPAVTPDPVEPAPTTGAPGTTMQDPQKAADTAYLQSLIDGTGDLLAEDTFEKLEPMFTTYEGDAEMMAMLERAAEAYGNAAVEAAKQALAA